MPTTAVGDGRRYSRLGAAAGSHCGVCTAAFKHATVHMNSIRATAYQAAHVSSWRSGQSAPAPATASSLASGRSTMREWKHSSLSLIDTTHPPHSTPFSSETISHHLWQCRYAALGGTTALSDSVLRRIAPMSTAPSRGPGHPPAREAVPRGPGSTSDDNAASPRERGIRSPLAAIWRVAASARR
jgi:hypothetical protein